MPERDIESLGVMAWGLEAAKKLFRRRRRRRCRRPLPLKKIKKIRRLQKHVETTSYQNDLPGGQNVRHTWRLFVSHLELHSAHIRQTKNQNKQ